MKKMKIYTRLVTSFAIVIVLSLILGVVGAVMVNIVSAKATELYDMHVLGMEELSTAQVSYKYMRLVVNKAAFEALNRNAENIKSLKDEYNATRKLLTDALTVLDTKLVSEDGKTALEMLLNFENDYTQAVLSYFEVCLNSATTEDTTSVLNGLASVAAKSNDVEQKFTEIVSIKTTNAEKANETTNVFSFWAAIAEIGLIIIIIAVSMFIALFIANGIEKSLRDIIEKLTISTMNISSSAAQLTDASESLATGSSRQAASIEETSATMNETSSMVAQNAENTRVASQLSSDATNEVNETSKVMSELMLTMGELKESSDKVSRIVKTIDDIAFQTNLLAINATVEAARAGGDAGRSFAVVAQEVRSLAQKSASASAETAEIIEKNISLTDSSRSAAERVVSVTQSSAAHIADLGKLISEINAASEEQASGIKQINIAVSQMEKVTQENAAVAEENAASSNSMRDEIANLDSAIVIAKELIRNADSTSGSSKYQPPRSSSGSGGSRPVKTQTTSTLNSSSTPTYKKTSSSNSASTSSKNDAEKIIPLDNDDDF